MVKTTTTYVYACEGMKKNETTNRYKHDLPSIVGIWEKEFVISTCCQITICVLLFYADHLFRKHERSIFVINDNGNPAFLHTSLAIFEA